MQGYRNAATRHTPRCHHARLHFTLTLDRSTATMEAWDSSQSSASVEVQAKHAVPTVPRCVFVAASSSSDHTITASSPSPRRTRTEWASTACNRSQSMAPRSSVYRSSSSSANSIALSAAPLRRLSPEAKRLIPPGNPMVSRTRPTRTSSMPAESRGVGTLESSHT
jgi:hypothetical protein